MAVSVTPGHCVEEARNEPGKALEVKIDEWTSTAFMGLS